MLKRRTPRSQWSVMKYLNKMINWNVIKICVELGGYPVAWRVFEPEKGDYKKHGLRRRWLNVHRTRSCSGLMFIWSGSSALPNKWSTFFLRLFARWRRLWLASFSRCPCSSPSAGAEFVCEFKSKMMLLMISKSFMGESCNLQRSPAWKEARKIRIGWQRNQALIHQLTNQ